MVMVQVGQSFWQIVKTNRQKRCFLNLAMLPDQGLIKVVLMLHLVVLVAEAVAGVEVAHAADAAVVSPNQVL